MARSLEYELRWRGSSPHLPSSLLPDKPNLGIFGFLIQ
jgi:hypothetical protein